MSRNEEFARPVEPLPMEEGLYYRRHPAGRPFGRSDAVSAPTGLSPDMARRPEYAPKEGYSAYWNPHHLDEYVKELHWGRADDHVLAFRGKAVGAGFDAEPLVMPHSDRPEMVLSPRQFDERLAATPGRMTSLYRHTWGDGPHGKQVDDGYE